MALASFKDMLKGRKVVIFTDNKGAFERLSITFLSNACYTTGAEGSMVRGSAKAFDHNQLIHDIWSLALESGIAIWIERVPSKYNVADSPSRHEWKILDDLGKT